LFLNALLSVQELLDSTIAGAADPHTTLVVYMGLQTLPSLVERLSGAGMPLGLPAVAVERGTTKRQRVVWGTVGELPQLATAAGLKSPALIIMGEVGGWLPGYVHGREA
jgi:siroheme synthase